MMFAYVGSRTTRERNARGEGLSVYRVSADQRTLTRVQVLDMVNPSFLALNRRCDRLYTVHGDGHEVSVMAVAPVSGELTVIQRQDCRGRNPVHLALDAEERLLLVSNHLTHTLAVMPVLADGRLADVSQLLAMPGEPGPHRVEQPFSKPHHNPFDPSGRFVAVPDKGLNRIFVFGCEDGRVCDTPLHVVETRETAGPRHVAFHPSRGFAYVVNELDSTITSYAFDSQCGALTPMQVLSTLPDHFTGNSRAAEIVIDSAGRHLYASNRGFDSVSVFRIGEDGRLAFIDCTWTGGKTPRFITLSPDGSTLFALNEDSDSIVAMAVSPSSGQLGCVVNKYSCGSPVCMVVSRSSCG